MPVGLLRTARLALCLVGLAVTLAGPGSLMAQPGASPARSPLDTPALEVGVNADFLTYGPEESAGLIEALTAAGVEFVRQPVPWASLERSPGTVEWTALDQVVQRLEAAGIRPLLNVFTSPEWARRPVSPESGLWLCDDPGLSSPGVERLAPPAQAGDLARFVAALAERYGSRLAGIEVWREPNLLPNWDATGPDPEAYADVLQAVVTRLGTQGSQVPVVSAGLAPTTDVGVCHMSDVVFLERMAAAGGLDGVAAVGVEPFGLRDTPTAVPDREALNYRRLEVLHATLDRVGVDRPLAAMAFGWHASGDPDSSGSPWGSHAPADASDYLAVAPALARQHYPWLTAGFVWHLHPPVPAEDPAWGFALFDRDMEPTALWAGLTRGLDGEGRRLDLPPAPEPAPWGPLAILALVGLAVIAARRLEEWAAVRHHRDAVRALVPAWLGRWVPAETASGRMAALYAAVAVTAGTYATLVAPRLRAAGLGEPDLALSLDLVSAVDLAVGVAVPATLAVLAVLSPAAAVATATGAAVLGGLAPLPVLGGLLDSFQVLVLLAAVGTVTNLVLGKANSDPGHLSRPTGTAARVGLHWLDGAVVLLLLWGALSPWWARYPELAAREWRVAMLAPALVYALVRWRRALLPAALAGLCWAAVLAGLLGLAATGANAVGLEMPGAVVAEGVVRAAGPFGSPNNLALIVGRVLAFVGVLVLWQTAIRHAGSVATLDTAASGPARPAVSGSDSAMRRTASAAAASLPTRPRMTTAGATAGDASGPSGAWPWVPGAGGLGWPTLAAMAFLAAAALATFSRGFLVVGLPVTVLLMSWLWWIGRRPGRADSRAGPPDSDGSTGRRVRSWALAASTALLLVAFLAVFGRTERLTGVADPSPGTTLYLRLRLWESSLEMVRDHAVLGVGLDNFLPAYRDLYVQRTAVQERFLNHPHNWVLDWWLRLGLPGLLAFGAVVAGNVALGVSVLRRHGPTLGWAVCGAALAMQLYALGHGLVDNHFFLPELATAWWLGQALLLAFRE